MTNRKLVKRHLVRAGNSIPAAAKKLGLGEGTIRRAVDRGEIQIIEFGGLRRITDAEIERVRAMFGFVEPSEDNTAA
jgi:excisionase family DNA binding protein